MIEPFLISFLNTHLSVPVYAEEPESPPNEYVIIERTGGTQTDLIDRATIAAQSYGLTMLDAIALNERVKEAFDDLRTEDAIGACRLESDYNFTDTTTKRYRYQAVFLITYYKEAT